MKIHVDTGATDKMTFEPWSALSHTKRKNFTTFKTVENGSTFFRAPSLLPLPPPFDWEVSKKKERKNKREKTLKKSFFYTLILLFFPLFLFYPFFSFSLF